MKLSLCLVLASMLCVTAAFAGEFKLPDDKPVVSFTIPDSWKPSAYDNGVEATSDDGEVYIAIEATDTKGVSDAITEAAKYLKKNGVTVKEDTMKQKQDKLNGMDVFDISWEGTDKDGPCKISLTVVAVTEDKGILLTYWASPEGEKKNGKDLGEIAESIKPIK